MFKDVIHGINYSIEFAWEYKEPESVFQFYIVFHNVERRESEGNSHSIWVVILRGIGKKMDIIKEVYGEGWKFSKDQEEKSLF